MSEFKVEVVPVVLKPHPNADSLSIAIVKGWHCVVRTADFDGAEMGAYIPIGAQLPDEPRWEFIKKGNSKLVVKTIRLRGLVSQGLLIPAEPAWKAGEDVASLLGVTKYDPPVPVSMGGETIPSPPGLQVYTDIEHWKSYPEVFADGERVVITEKLHGTNCRVAVVDGGDYVGSHKQVLREGEKNLYWRVARELGIHERLRATFPGKGVCLYGEIIGYGVQDLTYGMKAQTLRAFDLLVDGRYLDQGEFVDAAKAMGLVAVPLLREGEWGRDLLKLAEGRDAVSSTHVREGIVIRPEREGFDERLGRKILKYISDEYYLRKGGTEYH